MSKKVKQSFFGWLKCPEKCCFCSDEKKAMNFLFKPVLSCVLTARRVGQVRAGILWGDNVSGSVGQASSGLQLEGNRLEV